MLRREQMSRSPIPSHEEIDNRPVKCMVCGKEKTFAESMPAEMVRDSLVRIIRMDARWVHLQG
jgi:hypothetical protein